MYLKYTYSLFMFLWLHGSTYNYFLIFVPNKIVRDAMFSVSHSTWYTVVTQKTFQTQWVTHWLNGLFEVTSWERFNVMKNIPTVTVVKSKKGPACLRILNSVSSECKTYCRDFARDTKERKYKKMIWLDLVIHLWFSDSTNSIRNQFPF